MQQEGVHRASRNDTSKVHQHCSVCCQFQYLCQFQGASMLCSVCCSPTIRGRVFSVTPLLPLWWLVMGDVAPVCMARQSNAEQYRDCKREIMAARVQSVISGRAQKRRMFPRINVCCSLMQCTRWKLRCAKMSLIYYSMDLWNAAYAVHFISNLKAD